MATFVLIRHGEKHHWHDGCPPSDIQVENYQDDHKLSGKGRERALGLAGYFQRPIWTKLFQQRPLECLVAQDVDTTFGIGKSERPKATLLPMQEQLKLPLELFPKRNVREMVEHLLSERFIGKSVVICWSHQGMSELASMLGVVDPPSKWPKKRYDVTWLIQQESNGSCQFNQLDQKILFGDE